MSNDRHPLERELRNRRTVLSLLGAIPVLTVAGCGGSDDDGTAGEKAAEAVDSAKETAGEAAREAREMAADAADATGEAMDDMADGASDMADSAGEAMDDAMEKAGDMAADAKDAMGDAADEAKAMADDAMEQGKEMAAEVTAGGDDRVDESGATAMALGYKHDASEVDTGKYPQFKAGSQCANCALYQGGDAAWGACAIFPGKKVAAKGWCSSWVAKPA